mmetsp:Transcript_899/g.2912  ORF Transcript_899/g.2912 Transcript_899/m.2912 type:complete len:343 (-) Transcript_899:409-1437(-)
MPRPPMSTRRRELRSPLAENTPALFDGVPGGMAALMGPQHKKAGQGAQADEQRRTLTKQLEKMLIFFGRQDVVKRWHEERSNRADRDGLLLRLTFGEDAFAKKCGAWWNLRGLTPLLWGAVLYELSSGAVPLQEVQPEELFTKRALVSNAPFQTTGDDRWYLAVGGLEGAAKVTDRGFVQGLPLRIRPPAYYHAVLTNQVKGQAPGPQASPAPMATPPLMPPPPPVRVQAPTPMGPPPPVAIRREAGEQGRPQAASPMWGSWAVTPTSWEGTQLGAPGPSDPTGGLLADNFTPRAALLDEAAAMDAAQLPLASQLSLSQDLLLDTSRLIPNGGVNDAYLVST